MSNGDGPTRAERTLDRFTRHVERGFTCTNCGSAVVHDVPLLQAVRTETCLNCGEWTTHATDFTEFVETAREVSSEISGPILTERQALAYLLRERLDVNRQTTAEVMESTASNVDNLHRRAREKIDAARETVAALDALQSDRPETSDEQ